MISPLKIYANLEAILQYPLDINDYWENEIRQLNTKSETVGKYKNSYLVFNRTNLVTSKFTKQNPESTITCRS